MLTKPQPSIDSWQEQPLQLWQERVPPPAHVRAVEKFGSFSEDSDDEDDDDPPDNTCRQRVTKLIQSTFWHRLVLIVIILNILTMVLEAECGSVRKLVETVSVVDEFFLLFFLLEIVLRMYVDGIGGFFCNDDSEEKHWNWADFTIVAMGLAAHLSRPWRVENHLEREQQIKDRGDNVSKSLLQLRVFRIIRVVRVFKRLRQLQLLIRGMFKSFEAVFWIVVLGFLIILIFAVATTNAIGQHSYLWDIEHCPKTCDATDQARIKELFGDLGKSMWTMFQFITLDDWADIINLVAKRLWIMKWFFLFYTLIASFALISLLTGVMAEQMMSESKETQEQNDLEDIKNYITSLKRFFSLKSRRVGNRGPQVLTLHDLERLLEDPEVKGTLKQAGLDDIFDQEELNDAFRAMDLDGSGTLTWDEFLRGLKSITGPASARELSLVRKDVKRVLRSLEFAGSARRSLSPRQDTLGDRLSAMEDRLSRLEVTQNERLTRIETVVLNLARTAQASSSTTSLHMPP